MQLSPSAHVDTFCRDNLPPDGLWPELKFTLPGLRYPDRLNAAAALLDATADARRPPGDTGPTPATPSRRMFQKGLQTISWKGDDEDWDRLIYSLQYRREGEATWHDLRSGLTDGIFVWDTASVADGRYIVKVLASDSPSNASDRALVGEVVIVLVLRYRGHQQKRRKRCNHHADEDKDAAVTVHVAGQHMGTIAKVWVKVRPSGILPLASVSWVR